MSFATRLKKLTDYIYSPTNPASEDAIRGQIDGSVQEVYDNVVNVLESTTQGASGAYNIGINSVGVTASNVEDAVAEVQANISGATLGEIPNNTLTEAKMAAEMKKQAGGVYPYDDGDTNATNIANNTGNITTLENELDILRTAKDSTGTVNAYILDTPAVFDYTVDGNLVNFNPNFTNNGAATIAIDGTTKSIKKFDIDTDAYVILEEGDIKKNNPLTLRFDVSEDFFVLAPKTGAEKRGNLILNVSGTGTAIVTQTVNYSGKGRVKSIINTAAAVYEWYMVIDGVRYPTTGNYEFTNDQGVYMDFPFENSFEFYSENARIVPLYTEDGTLKCPTTFSSAALSTLKLSVSGSGRINGLSIGNGSRYQLLIDGVQVFGASATQEYLVSAGNFNIDTEYTTGFDLYTTDTNNAINYETY